MLFVFIDIRIGVIDIFADPIGYWFVYYGAIRLIGIYPISRRAKNGSVMLAFLSIPTVFISKNAIFHPLSFLGIYIPLLQFLTIIVMLFLFQLMLQIAKEKSNVLYKQTRLFSIVYISAMILIFLFQSFSTTTLKMGLENFIILLSIITFVLNITFLVWLFRFRMFPGDR